MSATAENQACTIQVLILYKRKIFKSFLEKKPIEPKPNLVLIGCQVALR